MSEYEAETILRYDNSKEDAYLWSASSIFHRHMERLGIAPVKVDQREGSAPSMWYRVPKSWVVVRKPRMVILSEEQKLAGQERLARWRQNRKEGVLATAQVETVTDTDPE